MNLNKVKILGFILLGLSFLSLGSILIIPFCIEGTSRILTINAALLIISEGSFALSILILGKEFWQKIKLFFKTTFTNANKS